MKRKLKKGTWIGLILFLIAVIVIIGFICINKAEKSKGEEESAVEQNSEITSSNSSSETFSETDSQANEVSSENDTEAESQTEPFVPTHASSFEENKDMAAWITIPGTNIDYPVMQTPDDEEYYLRRDFNGNSDNNGCLIMDTDSDVQTPGTNLIIHGHNMKSGAMFGTLTDYEDETFCKEHSTITLETSNELRTYEVIAVFRSQVYKKSYTGFKFYQFFEAATQEEFENFYTNIKELSLYDTGVQASYGDHFITLSTCAYHVERGRFVVVAKQL